MTEYINRGSMICYEMRLLGQEPQNIDLVAAALAGLPDKYDTTGTAGADGAHVAERRHGAAHRGEGEAEADGAGIRAGAGGARGRDDGRRPAGLSAAATTANRRTRGQTAVLRLWPHRPYATRLPHQLLPAPAQRRLPRGCAGRATRVDSSSRGTGTTIRGATPRVGLSRPTPGTVTTATLADMRTHAYTLRRRAIVNETVTKERTGSTSAALGPPLRGQGSGSVLEGEDLWQEDLPWRPFGQQPTSRRASAR